jgi:hypothetical protein
MPAQISARTINTTTTSANADKLITPTKFHRDPQITQFFLR